MTGGTGSADDFAGTTGTVGEYDNIYDESGVQKVDEYAAYDYSDYTDPGTTGSGTTGSASGGTTSASSASYTQTKPKTVSRTPQPVSAGARYHVVQKGETLYRLSLNYGTSVVSIQDANSLDGDLIKIGQRLVIPPR